MKNSIPRAKYFGFSDLLKNSFMQYFLDSNAFLNRLVHHFNQSGQRGGGLDSGIQSGLPTHYEMD
jgi:hypothetical protein